MSWNEYILTEFPETAFSRINILFDPQAIVADEAVFAELDRRGYLIQDFSDTISLRYTYESKVRNRLDAKWLILVRDERTTRNDLPYDIVRQAREVHFSLEALFPNLNFDAINSWIGNISQNFLIQKRMFLVRFKAAVKVASLFGNGFSVFRRILSTLRKIC